ncbi:MAG: hypothetical protein ACXACY_29945, partial [Candidatus Hodarchaeales archaeon]
FMLIRDAQSYIGMLKDSLFLSALYHSLLFPLIKIFPYPHTFQIYHLFIIIAAVFVFNRHAPFTPLQKTFFSFGYFILFEYGMISRPYSMLLLYLFVLMYFITRRKQNFIIIVILLLLLANHYPYGLFISLSVLTYLAIHIGNRLKVFSPKEKKHVLIAVAILILGGIFIYLQYTSFTEVNRFKEFKQAPYFMTIRAIWNGFFPVPNTTGIQFWNTNIIPFPLYYHQIPRVKELLTAGNIITATVSFSFLLASIVVFSKKLPVMISFLSNISIQLIFLQYLSIFFIRYQGILLIIFIYHFWLLAYSDEGITFLKLDRINDLLNKKVFISIRNLASPTLTIILSVQFCVGIFAYAQDIRFPFTASYRASVYIKENNLHSNIMVGHIDYVAQSIAGQLNEKIYYPQSNEYGTKVLWGKNRKVGIHFNYILDRSVLLLNKYNKNILLILNYPLRDNRMRPVMQAPISNNIRLKFIKEFTEAIVQDERYFLYLIYKARDNKYD